MVAISISSFQLIYYFLYQLVSILTTNYKMQIKATLSLVFERTISKIVNGYNENEMVLQYQIELKVKLL